MTTVAALNTPLDECLFEKVYLNSAGRPSDEVIEICPREGWTMNCSFDKLVLYLDKQLDLDQQLEVLGHLDECFTCLEAVYQISRDRDSKYFVTKPYRLEKIPAG